MQVKSAASTTSAKPPAVLSDETLIKPPMTTKTITVFVDHPSKWNNRHWDPAGEVHADSKFADIPFNVKNNWQKVSSQFHQHNGITFVNQETQIDEFSVVTPELSNFIKPVDTAFFNLIREGDLCVTTYLKELIRLNKPE